MRFPFYIVANYKMKGTSAFFQEALTIAQSASHGEALQFILCPPAPFLYSLSQGLEKQDKAIALGAQDCSTQTEGSFTGDMSAHMLSEVGAAYVLLGHSECRKYKQDDNQRIKAKISRAQEAGLIPILCIGASWEQEQKGEALQALYTQIDACLEDISPKHPLLIAHEPLWAIGTGKTPSPETISYTHAALHDYLSQKGYQVPLLYGGSVGPDNYRTIATLPHVDGILIGRSAFDLPWIRSILSNP